MRSEIHETENQVLRWKWLAWSASYRLLGVWRQLDATQTHAATTRSGPHALDGAD